MGSISGVLRRASNSQDESSVEDPAQTRHGVTEHQLLRWAPPLDFSFARLRHVDELLDGHLEPRADRLHKKPKRTKKRHYVTRSLWLSHNLLRTTQGVRALSDLMLWRPLTLAWLDLSHNLLVELGAEIAEFHQLSIIYLHGNHIHTLSGIAVLRELPYIAHLTLHGNPIAHIPFYRGRVLTLLPQLRSLDGSCVLPSEREAPLPVYAPDFTLSEQPPVPPKKEVEQIEAAAASWLELLKAEMTLRRLQRLERKRPPDDDEAEEEVAVQAL